MYISSKNSREKHEPNPKQGANESNESNHRNKAKTKKNCITNAPDSDRYFIDKQNGKLYRIIYDNEWPIYLLPQNTDCKKYFIKRHPKLKFSFIKKCMVTAMVLLILALYVGLMLLLPWLAKVIPYGLYVELILLLMVTAVIYKIYGIKSGYDLGMLVIGLISWIIIRQYSSG